MFLLPERTRPKAWDNMIPDIHGEHYRVTAAQWNHHKQAVQHTGVRLILLSIKKKGVIQKYTGFQEWIRKRELMKALREIKTVFVLQE